MNSPIRFPFGVDEHRVDGSSTNTYFLKRKLLYYLAQNTELSLLSYKDPDFHKLFIQKCYKMHATKILMKYYSNNSLLYSSKYVYGISSSPMESWNFCNQSINFESCSSKLRHSINMWTSNLPDYFILSDSSNTNTSQSIHLLENAQNTNGCYNTTLNLCESKDTDKIENQSIESSMNWSLNSKDSGLDAKDSQTNTLSCSESFNDRLNKIYKESVLLNDFHEQSWQEFIQIIEDNSANLADINHLNFNANHLKIINNHNEPLWKCTDMSFNQKSNQYTNKQDFIKHMSDEKGLCPELCDLVHSTDQSENAKYSNGANTLFSVFNDIDENVHEAVEELWEIKRSMQAFRISNQIEKRLAFHGLILDENDRHLFFTYKQPVIYNPNNNLSSDIHCEISPDIYEQMQLYKRNDCEDWHYVSSGSMSDTSINCFFTVTPTVYDNPTTSSEDNSQLVDLRFQEKKLQMKIRRQEKEQRIRLALLGMDPQDLQDTQVLEDLGQDSQNFQVEFKSLSNNEDKSKDTHKFNNIINDYRRLRRYYSSTKMKNRLNVSFDSERLKSDPYKLYGSNSMKEKEYLELKHSQPAYAFVGVPTRLFPLYVNRFHKTDFRIGFYEGHTESFVLTDTQKMSYDNKNPNEKKKGQHHNLTNGSEMNPIPYNVLWNTWTVQPPRISNIVKRLHCLSDENDSLRTNNSETIDEYKANYIGQSSHPADFIQSVDDLTLSDQIPVALLEYCEQNPPLLNNVGMVGRITQYYRPPSDNMSMAQMRKRMRRKAGELGSIKIIDNSIPFLGSQMHISKNQGITMFSCPLFKAPIFAHPTNINAPFRKIPYDPTDSRYGATRYHDYRMTDFLLCRVLQRQNNDSAWTHRVYIRPIYLDLIEDERLNDIDLRLSKKQNRAHFTVFTVGHTQPNVEVPSPSSKKCLDIRRDWLRSYALRLAREGLTSFNAVKLKCQAKFKNIFEPCVLQKHLISCKYSANNQSENSISIFQPHNTTGHSIQVVDEDHLIKVCPLENICTLLSCYVANNQLSQLGIHYLRSNERVSSAVRELEEEEIRERDKLSKLLKNFNLVDSRFWYKVRNLPMDNHLRMIFLNLRKDGPLVSIEKLISKKNLVPVARLIEEILYLTPWNITHDCVDVVSRQGGQFYLEGFVDCSGGRGEGISLVKYQKNDNDKGWREGLRGNTSDFKEIPKEDLRKLSMKELHERLIKFGFDSQTVKSLPRWDQVALVRRFQYNNTGLLGDVRNSSKPGLMPNDLYIKKLNKIFFKQRRALEPDSPNITPSISDSGSLYDENASKNDQTSRTVEMNTLEEVLLSGLDLDSGENQNGKNEELAEKQALGEFRASLGKVDEVIVSNVSTRLSKIFKPEEIYLLQSKPIPRLKWTYKFYNPRNGEFKFEKTILIYGEENIRYFWEWKKNMVASNPKKESLEQFHGQTLGTASRSCRRCGQIGHISSNPICPQYTGPRKSRIPNSMGIPANTPNSRQYLISAGSYVDDDKYESVTNESQCKADFKQPYNIKNKRKFSIDPKYNAVIGEKTRKSTYKKDKNDERQLASLNPDNNMVSDASSYSKNSIMNIKLPTRTTARQRRILESRGSLVGEAVQTYQGSVENAITEINQIFHRVLSKTDRDRQKWISFRDPVSDLDAPGYSSIIKNPVCLNQMVEKCKSREYKNVVSFMADIDLMVENCYRYNPYGHWLHPLVKSLKEFLIHEITLEGPWLTELDRFIQEHTETSHSNDY